MDIFLWWRLHLENIHEFIFSDILENVYPTKEKEISVMDFAQGTRSMLDLGFLCMVLLRHENR